MGLFDGNNEANDLMEQQMRQNQAELEEKRQNLYRERLDIIKSQGAQSFTPEYGDQSLPVQHKGPLGQILDNYNKYVGYDFIKGNK